MADQKVKFNYGDVFHPNCMLSQFITVLTQIHSNLSLCHKNLAIIPEHSENIHSDTYIYFLANTLSHCREAVKSIGLWIKEPEVRDFVARFELEILLQNIRDQNIDYKSKIIWTFAKNVRDKIFHYTEPAKRNELAEVIEGINLHSNETFIIIKENIYKIETGFSANVISGLVSHGSFTSDDLELKMGEIMPILVDVMQFCAEAIGLFLVEKDILDID